MPRSRYIMIGGFLGAGKSTAMGRLARHLTDLGQTVGLITNDQGTGLVDTSNLRSQGFRVEEIPGGCFCCRFGSLVDAARKLTAESRPDVFLAEPVGSCTDLVATVGYPLRRIYGDDYLIAPFSVLVDPVRASRVLGLESGRGFSSKVTYVYRKQLEEASYIIINKRDLLTEAELRRLREALESEYPGRPVFEVSARDGEGLDEWFDRLATSELASGDSLEIDYDVYAEGEARLGWLNGTLKLLASQGVDGNALLLELARGLGRRLEGENVEIAHLKMTLVPGENPFGQLGLVSLVRGDFVPELSEELPEPVTVGEVIVNLRAEGSPELLRDALESEIDARSGTGGLELRIEHVESFRPGRPVPTHRIANEGEQGFSTP